MTAAEWAVALAPGIGFLIGFAAHIAWSERKQAQKRKRWAAEDKDWEDRWDKLARRDDLFTSMRRIREGMHAMYIKRRWGLDGTHYLPDVIDLDVNRYTDRSGRIIRVEYKPRPDRINTAEKFWEV